MWRAGRRDAPSFSREGAVTLNILTEKAGITRADPLFCRDFKFQDRGVKTDADTGDEESQLAGEGPSAEIYFVTTRFCFYDTLGI